MSQVTTAESVDRDGAQNADLQRRFGGLQRLYGIQGAQQIQSAHVVVVGIGGVGSWAAEGLARSGVGRITLVDMDHIAESNINRQVHALTTTLGQAKVEAMCERIAQINPFCVVNCLDVFVDDDNWATLLPASAQGVIDACDDARAKLAMAAWAVGAGKSKIFITVGAAGGKKMAHQVAIDDLSCATHDPLLAKLRYALRKHHAAPRGDKKIGVACVFSPEPIMQPDMACAQDQGGHDGSLNCHGYGSTVSVTASFGLCAAGWMIEKISVK